MKTTDSIDAPDAGPVKLERGEHPRERTISRRRGWTRMIAGAVFAVLLLAVFGRHLVALFTYAAGTDLHSHILLVPFVSAYLLWINRERWPKRYSTSIGGAAVAAIVGILALIAALAPAGLIPPYSENDFLALIAFSFVAFLVAGGFLFLGGAWMRAAAFPVGFLIFLAPLPDAAVHWLETGSKYASADAADLFFQITGTPVLRDGLYMKLPGITLEVAQECSGIRSSWVLFITSLVASYLFLESPWRRAVLVLFVFPLAILRNGFRILVIGLLCVHIGPEMIDSIVHKRGGPVFFALSLIPLFALAWWLRRGEMRGPKLKS